MTIPPQFREDADQFPPLLRALLDAELATGNTILEVGHRFPAPPAGAYFKMSGPFTTRRRASGDGLKFRDHNSSTMSGSFTDDRGFYYLIEPPLPPPPVPDMDAIRAAHLPHPPAPSPITSDPNTALGRFERSMVMNYEKWHDGIGYDIEALRSATPAEREAIEKMLLDHGVKDWWDVEALAALDTPRAQAALRAAMGRDAKIRMAVTQYAPNLVPNPQRVASLVSAIGSADLYGGLSQALDEAAEFHPREVVDALFRAALRRNGEAAVNIAGLLLYIHGKADEPFDWGQRPFFIRFHSEDGKEREAVFRELCEKVGVEASKYL